FPVWNVVNGGKAVESRDLRLSRWRHERLEALFEVHRHNSLVEKEPQRGRRPVVSILPARVPHGIAPILRMKKSRLKVIFFGVDHLGDGRALKFIEALPNGLNSVTFEIPHDEVDKVAFSGRQFLLCQRT